jgi:hypothetical protein
MAADVTPKSATPKGSDLVAWTAFFGCFGKLIAAVSAIAKSADWPAWRYPLAPQPAVPTPAQVGSLPV